MKRSRRNCVSKYSNAASISSQKSKDSVKKETINAIKIEKEMKARLFPIDILVQKDMLTSKEEIASSDDSEIENQTPGKKRKDESEIENQTPEKKIKGDDYLKMIEENRQKSLAFLKSLNIDEVKDSFCSSVKALKPVRAKRQFKPKEVLPLRKSERLAKIHINLSEEALVRKVVKEAKEEMEVKKLAKVLPDTFKFNECVVEKNDFSDFQDHFSGLDFKKDPPKPIKFPDYFKEMKLKELTKVVPEKISSLTVHPSANQVIVTAGSKSGRMGFWNVTSNTVCMFECHSQGITNIKFNTHDPHKLLSSSYDGRILCGDMEELTFKKYYQADDDFTTCFDIVSSSTFIVGHGSGNVAIVDSRTNDGVLKKCVKRHDCHEYRIKRLNVHPVDQNYFASADTKGIIKVWDLRQLKEDPMCETRHHERSVSSAFFSPETGNSILSTSWDNHCCIFNSSDLSKGLTVEKNIKHNNNTGRWISPFQAVWVPNANEQFFAVGSLLYPRRVEVFDRQGSLVHEFSDENLSSILSLISFHPSLPVLAGGNSAGKVAVFQDL